MFLGSKWVSVDGVEFWIMFCETEVVSKRILEKLANKIHRERMLWSHEYKWLHKMAGQCTWGKVVRRNTNDTIDRFKDERNWNRDLCSTCRGKGHSWKAQIWNGKPYLVAKNEQPKGDHWKNPDYCRDCKGSGFV